MKSALSARLCFLMLCFVVPVGMLSAQTANLPLSVSQSIEKAASTDEAVTILRKSLAATPAPSATQKVQLLAFLASLLEQTGQYQEAQYQYSMAANASATVNNAAGRGAVASPEYLLGAVRCALSVGDTTAADYILSTAFFDIKDQTVIAQVKLYAVWSWLCKIDSENDLQQPVTALKSFLQLSAMNPVRPSVLLTLWYITGSSDYAGTLQKEFPDSTECAVVQGEAQIMPTAFWYFLPGVASRSEKTVTVAKVETASDSAAVSSHTGTENSASAEKMAAVTEEKTEAVHWQLGFFRNRDNAQDLVTRVTAAGFSAQIHEEKRPSGTVYFTVTVTENKAGTMGQELRNAGFECYPVYE